MTVIKAFPDVVWKPIPRGLRVDSLLGFNENGVACELRRLVDPSTADVTAERSKLIQLLSHRSVRPVLRCDVSSTPPTIELALPDPTSSSVDPFETVFTQLDDEDRVRIAMQCVEAIEAAHRVGLTQGQLADDDLILFQDAEGWRLWIDFTATTGNVAESDMETDLHHVRDRMLQWLDRKQIPGDWIDDDEPPSLNMWLGKISTLMVATHGTEQLNVPSLSVDDPTSLNDVEPAIRNNTRQAEPTRLGRFDLVQRIGSGAMGTVYRAIDQADGSTVAVKLLRPVGGDMSQAVRRFRKEVRLLRDVQNDLVTRLIDAGEDAGHHYLVMEFIEGIDLRKWLNHNAPLDEATTLTLATDLARAMVDAHAQQIVHRDIKPENVLLGKRESDEADVRSYIDRPLSDFQLKLSDFGIARHVNQTSSMEVTRVGSVLGTPRYMSPEQCRGHGDVGPASDVYSIGVILYQSLTGDTPFTGADFMELAHKHCFESPPEIQKRNASISDATVRLVNRALAKSVDDRHADAGQLLQDIQRLVHGDAASFEVHPRMPTLTESEAANVWDQTRSWSLESSPAELWPFVSNTERLNRAIGLPSVDYRIVKDPELGVRKFGSFRISGMTVSWEEHPFEWIEGHRMGILREFETGPYAWFLSVVTLEPSGSGTMLSHRLRLLPRNWLGRVLVRVEMERKGFRGLDRVYRRIDETLKSRRLEAANSRPKVTQDPFEAVTPLTDVAAERLQRRTETMLRLGADETATQRIVDALTHLPPQELAQMRPLRVADQWNVPSTAMIDACLIAASCGVLSLRWDVLCPTCRAPATTSDQLSVIAAHTHCVACDADFQSNLASAIELVFRAHPEIREVDETSYCIGGPEHSPHVAAQVRVEPSETVDLTMNLSVGDYLVRGPRLPRTQPLRIVPATAPSSWSCCLTRVGHGRHVPTMRRGRQTITLTNDLPVLHVVRIERTISRGDVVTAAMASTMPTFRKLFPNQTFAGDNPIQSDTMTLLAATIDDVQSWYTRLGDGEAYRLIQSRLSESERTITLHCGSVVKTMGDQLLASFADRQRAVDCALAMAFASSSFAVERINVAVVCGPVLMATQNGRLDLFGGTVRDCIAMLDAANGDILLDESIATDPAVMQRLQDVATTTIESMKLPTRQSARVTRMSINRAT